MKFRLLNKNEIDCRIGTISEKGLSLLLYKDARIDMKLLDEAGCIWKRSHELIGDRLYCTVSIFDKGLGEWVSRQDVGTESYTEKEKGQASDAFKRACVNWGIGRELYTAPFIWIPADKCKIVNKNGKYACYDDFKVTDIKYDADQIINLEISCNGKACYKYPNNPKPAPKGKDKAEKPDARQQTTEIIYQELKRTGIGLKNLLNNYRVADIKDMTQDMLNDAMTLLYQKPDKAKPKEAPKGEPKAEVPQDRYKIMALINKEMQRTGVIAAQICERYQVNTTEELTVKELTSVLNDLKKTKSMY